MSNSKRPVRGLYAITPDNWPAERLLQSVKAALAGGATTVQFRQKSLDNVEKFSQARALKALCDAHDARLIVNDDVALAQAVDADGVHLGRDDVPVANARQILGPLKVIGVSCYNQLTLADAAIRHGADYIAFGSFFPSRVKPMAVRADLALISSARTLLRSAPQVTMVAIGGITLDNVGQLIAAGVDAAAVISNLFEAEDISAQARAFTLEFDNHHSS
jgi:thiamine-phosphate pyrophosphorylase